jgi:hypothetical protein
MLIDDIELGALMTAIDGGWAIFWLANCNRFSMDDAGHFGTERGFYRFFH